MEVLFWIGLSLVVGSIAGRWGRSSVGWFLLALLFSPLLAGFVLLLVGKTMFRKPQEAVLVQQLAGSAPSLPLSVTLPTALAKKEWSDAADMAAPLLIVVLPTALFVLLTALLGGFSSEVKPHAWPAGMNEATEPATATATDKWPWLKTAKMTEEEAAQRACFDQNERMPDRKEDCSLPKVRERLNKDTTVAPAGPPAAAAKPRAIKQAATENVGNPTQDALARQLQAMPGVSRW
jgi:hypothetical protein